MPYSWDTVTVFVRMWINPMRHPKVYDSLNTMHHGYASMLWDTIIGSPVLEDPATVGNVDNT